MYYQTIQRYPQWRVINFETIYPWNITQHYVLDPNRSSNQELEYTRPLIQQIKGRLGRKCPDIDEEPKVIIQPKTYHELVVEKDMKYKKKQTEVEEQIRVLEARIAEVQHTIYWIQKILEDRRRLVTERPQYASYYKQLVIDSENELINKVLVLVSIRGDLNMYKNREKLMFS